MEKMIELANRLKDTNEYYFSKKLSEIAQMNASGADVINLGIGSPDMMPPAEVINELCHQSNGAESHGYQSYKGLPELRKAFADWYLKNYYVKLKPESEILPLIGSKEGIIHISMTYLQAGDEVLVPDPGYPAYSAAAKLAGATTKLYSLTESDNWLPDLETLERSDLSKVKIMWVNYPNMPTGAKAGKTLFEKLAAFGKKHNILICNDNPYSFILNDVRSSLLGSQPDYHTLELNSLSKSHNMAGWRMGMIAAHEAHIENILRFKSNMDSGMFLPIQKAAIKALQQDNGWHTRLNKEYEKRRKIVWQMLEALNCSYNKDQAGMFVWGKAPGSISDVEKWVEGILKSKEVFITPGFIFGSNGDRFIRISLCNNEERLTIALNRIKHING